jgi:hypothetical protein
MAEEAEDLTQTLQRLPEQQVRRILEHLSLVHPDIVSTAVVHVAQSQRQLALQDDLDDLASVETKRISNVSGHNITPTEDIDDPASIPPLLKRHNRTTSGGDKGLAEEAAERGPAPSQSSAEPQLLRRAKRLDPSVGDLQPKINKAEMMHRARSAEL